MVIMGDDDLGDADGVKDVKKINVSDTVYSQIYTVNFTGCEIRVDGKTLSKHAILHRS